CTTALNCCVPPAATVAEVGEMVTLTVVGVVVVDTAAPHTVAYACAPTVAVTVAGASTSRGVRDQPQRAVVNTGASSPMTPFTCQVTAVLLVFCTTALNCCVPPAATVAKIGEMVTLTEIGVGVVDTPAQPTVSNTVTPTAASHTQEASRSSVFRVQPRRSVFMAC